MNKDEFRALLLSTAVQHERMQGFLSSIANKAVIAKTLSPGTYGTYKRVPASYVNFSKTAALTEQVTEELTEKQAFEEFSEAVETGALRANGAPLAEAIHAANVAKPPALKLFTEPGSKPLSFAERLKLKQKAREAAELEVEASPAISSVAEETTTAHGDEVETKPLPLATIGAALTQETFALNIPLNEGQLAAKDLAFAGKSFCFIGAAGTGKTTGQRAVAKALLEQGKLEDGIQFKTYDADGKREYKTGASIAFCAFTRRAAANLRKAIHKDPDLAERLKHNITTIHALLEYEPSTYFDEIEQKEKFRFEPKRHAGNPLKITHLIIEEASMLGLDLWEKLYDAILPGTQIIFIGDLNQLPPVFGPSILNYALLQLPIIELTIVYRNQGIVLENAHNILGGKDLREEPGTFRIVRGNSEVQVGQEKTSLMLGRKDGFFHKLFLAGEYDPEQDIILAPWNEKFLGTKNLNCWIAQFLGEARGGVVHEVIAGFRKLYLAVGDKVMYNKMDGVITEIKINAGYFGKAAATPGSDLTRFGHRNIGAGATDDVDELVLDYSGISLEALEDEKAERKQQASHVIVVKMEGGIIQEISAAGEFSEQSFSLGYCLTCHKAQGSEWRKVFIIMHKDHAISLYREWFYTAVTRAKQSVNIIAKDFVVKKAITNQRIKGNTLKDKLDYFNSGVVNATTVFCTK